MTSPTFLCLCTTIDEHIFRSGRVNLSPKHPMSNMNRKYMMDRENSAGIHTIAVGNMRFDRSRNTLVCVFCWCKCTSMR